MRNLNLMHAKKLSKKELRSISGGSIADCYGEGCLDELCPPPANNYGCMIVSVYCAQKECRPDDCKTCYPIN